ALEFRNQLTGTTGLKLPATLIYDHPSPAGLATHLLERLDLDAEPESVAVPVLAGLAKLRGAIQEAAAESTAYEQITARLRELLDVAQAADSGSGKEPADDENSNLDAASDEELFALIDELD
ncbi:hypothetical protein, partial [Streptomyces sp. NPDC059909]|uniref:acyl carrier protein n=1 Tax=Streptomyces sp. NPDC059909 TaxID=3346998 RepID=UPI0036603C78